MQSAPPSSTNKPHIPVLMKEVLDALQPKDGETYIDATFGAGGYTREILEAANCSVIALDRDPRAIEAAGEMCDQYKDRLTLIETPFASMDTALADRAITAVDGVVMDLGVSSMQLDEADRGFSFRLEGPLSMRMDGAKPDAADVINRASAQDLKLIFKVYGEEKRAAPLAAAIVRARDNEPIITTRQLAQVIEAASPNPYSGSKGRGGKKGTKPIHPATRVFQALRIFVNNELGQLAHGLVAAEAILRPAGRLVAVTFHSLEARIVKRFFTDRTSGLQTISRHAPMIEVPAATFLVPRRGQVEPGEQEISSNPRARSSALRFGLRTDVPPRESTLDFAGLTDLSFSPPLVALELS